MKKLILIVLSMMFIAALGFSQEAGVPEKVKVSLDALLKTRTANGVFNMQSIDSFFYASTDFVFVNVLFSAELENYRNELKAKKEAEHTKLMEEYNAFVEKEEKKLEETNKKIREKNKTLQASKQEAEKTWEKPAAPELVLPKAFHNLYTRVVQDGNIIQSFKSPIPGDEIKADYYSFALILKPGQYDILVNINCFDDSQDGTLLIPLTVPNLTVADIVAPAKKIANSTPIFYKKINTLNTADERFTVVKNCYQVSPYKLELYPYIGKEYSFKASDTPILTFFILGVNQPWNVEVQVEIKQDKKKVVAFKIPPMENPYFFQLLEFVDKDKKPLAPGGYTLYIALTDNNQKSRQGVLEIPFKIIE